MSSEENMNINKFLQMYSDQLSRMGFFPVGLSLFKKIEDGREVEHFINFEIHAKNTEITIEFGTKNAESHRFGLECITKFGDRDGLYSEFYRANNLQFNVRNSLMIFLDRDRARPVNLSKNGTFHIEGRILDGFETEILPLLNAVRDIRHLCTLYAQDSRLYPFSSSNTAFRFAEYANLYARLYKKVPNIDSGLWRRLVSVNLRNGITFEDYIGKVIFKLMEDYSI